MDRGIKKVRDSINKRRKLRQLQMQRSTKREIIPPFIEEEEKHGYYSTYIDSLDEEQFLGEKKSRFPRFLIKGFLSIGLFFIVAIMMEREDPMFTQVNDWTHYAMTEEFPFARVNQWYQTTFGTPLSLSPIEEDQSVNHLEMALPVNGNVTETFQANGTGIKITPNEKTEVKAWNEGVVIFTGNDKETNRTVIIQHADNSKSTYGHLSSIDVHLYQLVGADQTIGTFTPSAENETVFFSLEKDNKYIDPIQVIQVDEIP